MRRILQWWRCVHTGGEDEHHEIRKREKMGNVGFGHSHYSRSLDWDVFAWAGEDDRGIQMRERELLQ
ncbi:hypothetical protein MA16_Dca011711 [Dendrobium catenatum]|uniref:Uncharacterized protein n=1 Tax=Dendrobium catenatum TaxID=906689 RepID=A0A2I0WY64_9ASPA|nr:hypothetical protein MA16_Dca011711 [Dendrobium catenatum]